MRKNFISKIFFVFSLTALLIANISVPGKAVAASASLYISPSSGNYKVGATVTATVCVNTGGQGVNAVEGTVSYPSDKLTFQSVSSSGSIVSIWTRSPSGNGSSTSFAGGMPEGYNGGGGKIVSITFKAKADGTASLSISGVQILADDGEGTNITGGSSGATFTIGNAPATPATKKPSGPPTPTTPTLRSPSHPDEATWYNNNKVDFTWTAGTGNTGYTFVFDQSASTVPPTTAPVTATSKSYDNVTDGTWYFHLRAKTDTAFLSTVSRIVQIDTTPPPKFTVTIDQSAGLTNPRPKIVFDAKDDTSGLAKIEAKLDGGDVFSPASGDSLPFLHPGKHSVVVKAFDKAGNATESSASFRVLGIDAPVVVGLTNLVGILDPICFQGNTSPDDTIFVQIDKTKAAEKFLAKDLLIRGNAISSKTPPVRSGQSTWQYCYKKMIIPGTHTFRFSRTDKNGAESESTNPFSVKVVAGTVRLGQYTIPMIYILFLAGVILFLLLIIILLLIVKLHKLAKKAHGKFISFTSWIKNSAHFSAKIESDVERVIPERNISKKEVDEIKTKLKKDIEKAEKELDETVEKIK